MSTHARAQRNRKHACRLHAACAALVPLTALWLGACSAEPTRAAAPREARPQAADGVWGDRYYLSTCAQCGTLLGARGEAVDSVLSHRDLRFCRAECRAAFNDDTAGSTRRIDEVMAADQLPHYPLDTSVVSRRPLPEAPVDVVCGNRLFRLCSAAERDELLVDPARWTRALDDACIAAQRDTYAMPDKCPVQGDILSSDTPIDIVIANRMVRVCCARCVRVVRARPYQYLAMIDYANRAAHQEPPHTPNP